MNLRDHRGAPAPRSSPLDISAAERSQTDGDPSQTEPPRKRLAIGEDRCRGSRPVARVYARRMDPERARELLVRERHRIMQSLAGAKPEESDEPTTTDQHMADQASDLYDNEFDEGLSDELRLELAAIERAERRLADGTYGLSVETGEPIPDERLEVMPAAERTAEEQARFERGA
jgi:DnaK suppressor protein